MDCCIDHGVNLIDTANDVSTGLAEEIVGEQPAYWRQAERYSCVD